MLYFTTLVGGWGGQGCAMLVIPALRLTVGTEQTMVRALAQAAVQKNW